MRLLIVMILLFNSSAALGVVLLRLQPTKSAAHFHVSHDDSTRFIPAKHTVIRNAKGKAIVVKTIAKRRGRGGSYIVADIIKGWSRLNQKMPIFYLRQASFWP